MGYVGARQAKRHSPQPPLFCWCRGQHLGGSGRAEASQQLGEEFLVRIGAGEKEADTTGVAQDDGADFEDLEPDGGGLGAGQFGADQPDAANGLDEHVSGAGKQESELVCPPSRSAGSVSEESELLLFDPIFHLATSAVDLVIELPCIAFETGHDEAWIRSFDSMLGFENDPAFPVPALGCVVDPGKMSLLLLALLEVCGGPLHDRLGLGK